MTMDKFSDKEILPTTGELRVKLDDAGSVISDPRALSLIRRKF